MKIWLCLLLGVLVLGGQFPVAAQSTAHGRLVSYNLFEEALVLDLDESDLRFNQIDTAGGIISLSVEDITLQAYLLPEARVTADLPNTIRLLGFNPQTDGIDLVLIVSRIASNLRHIDGKTNPMHTFKADIGDRIRVDAVASLPSTTPYLLDTSVAEINPDTGDVRLNLLVAEADTQGLFKNVTGLVQIGEFTKTFVWVARDDYFIAPPADLYLMPLEVDDETYLELVPAEGFRSSLNIGTAYAVTPDMPVTLSYTIPQTDAIGQITEIQADGQQFITDIPDTYLDELGIPLGGYAVVVINGRLRGAMVMDETMIASAFDRFGLGSNYILLRQTGILKLVYLMNDGRTLQSIFATGVGAPIRIRPAQAVETIVRAEAVVKAVAEIDPDGFLYSDISPIELSFLEVLVGEYVNLQINGIEYRSRVVDDALLAFYGTEDAPAEILLYPYADRLLITHTVNDTITAEGRFQASVGDAVIISRAPN